MNLTVTECKGLLAVWADTMTANRSYLIDLDSIVGDGDLGLTMSDGFVAAAKNAAAAESDDLGNLFYFAGKAMSTAVPSTMGTLMASGLMEAGKTLKKRTELPLGEIGTLFSAYMNGVMLRGKAKPGDKTFLDGMAPAIAVLEEGRVRADVREWLSEAAAAAAEGAQRTTTMLAVHGRAATRGEASRSLLDPGAVVAQLLLESTCAYLKTLL